MVGKRHRDYLLLKQQLQGIFTSQDKNSTCADFLMSSKGKKPPFLKAGNWSMAETEYRPQSGTIRRQKIFRKSKLNSLGRGKFFLIMETRFRYWKHSMEA